MSNANKSLRFFSNSSIVDNSNNHVGMQDDPTPFGMQFQENFGVNHKQDFATTMGPSATNTPSGSDSCIDFDFHF